MNHLCSLGVFAFSFCLSVSGFAEILPSFGHKYLAKNSEVIVLATEGESIDGEVTVLATYKGEVSIGSKISLPALKVFKDPKERKTHVLFGGEQPRFEQVTGSLMILFLRMEDGKLVPTSNDPKWHDWLCWIEGGVVYAKIQVINPGPSMLQEYGRWNGSDLGGILGDISKAVAKGADEDEVGEGTKKIGPSE